MGSCFAPDELSSTDHYLIIRSRRTLDVKSNLGARVVVFISKKRNDVIY